MLIKLPTQPITSAWRADCWVAICGKNKSGHTIHIVIHTVRRPRHDVLIQCMCIISMLASNCSGGPATPSWVHAPSPPPEDQFSTNQDIINRFQTLLARLPIDGAGYFRLLTVWLKKWPLMKMRLLCLYLCLSDIKTGIFHFVNFCFGYNQFIAVI